MGANASYDGCISLGPWGGSQGENWVYMPKGTIKKINVVHGRVIDAITFQSDSSMDKTETSFFGGVGGDNLNTITIDYPSEYLTSISGTFGSYKGSVVVNSLCFGTNQKLYGPYGSDTGTRFSYDGKGGVIVGFHGSCGDQYLDAVGIYVMPESLAFGRTSTSEDKSMHELCSSMSKMAMPREAGPWGGSGGKPWDDGVFSHVKKVIVHGGVSLNAICAIQFEYVKRDAKSNLSQMHGGVGEVEMELLSVVNFDGVGEYLTGISGFYGPVKGYNGLEAITSITFHTNKTTHGPYGEESGAGYTYFTSTASPGKVVGFHGRSLSNNNFSNKVEDAPTSARLEPHNDNLRGQGKDQILQQPSILKKPGSSANDEVASIKDIAETAPYINETEKMWHYKDPSGKIQGPFSMAQLREWNNNKFFPASLRIWRKSEKENDGIPLTDALKGRLATTSVEIPKPSPDDRSLYANLPSPTPNQGITGLGPHVGPDDRNDGFVRAIGVHMEYF